jgi:hypothetical protein
MSDYSCYLRNSKDRVGYICRYKSLARNRVYNFRFFDHMTGKTISRDIADCTYSHMIRKYNLSYRFHSISLISPPCIWYCNYIGTHRRNIHHDTSMCTVPRPDHIPDSYTSSCIFCHMYVYTTQVCMSDTDHSSSHNPYPRRICHCTSSYSASHIAPGCNVYNSRNIVRIPWFHILVHTVYRIVVHGDLSGTRCTTPFVENIPWVHSSPDISLYHTVRRHIPPHNRDKRLGIARTPPRDSSVNTSLHSWAPSNLSRIPLSGHGPMVLEIRSMTMLMTKTQVCWCVS